MSKRIGVVLVFAAGTERAIAQATIDKLVREGLVDVTRYDANLQAFDPEKGAPVWYIP